MTSTVSMEALAASAMTPRNGAESVDKSLLQYPCWFCCGHKMKHISRIVLDPKGASKYVSRPHVPGCTLARSFIPLSFIHRHLGQMFVGLLLLVFVLLHSKISNCMF
jgi:hypothetical protein